MTYVGGKVISVIRLYPPLLIIVHARLGYGFDLGSNLVLAQFVGADLGGFIAALMWQIL